MSILKAIAAKNSMCVRNVQTRTPTIVMVVGGAIPFAIIRKIVLVQKLHYFSN